jgi:hypothetical protein
MGCREGLEEGGRGGGIRTRDLLVPNQLRYQAALRPDEVAIVLSPAHAAATLGAGAANINWRDTEAHC